MYFLWKKYKNATLTLMQVTRWVSHNKHIEHVQYTLKDCIHHQMKVIETSYKTIGQKPHRAENSKLTRQQKTVYMKKCAWKTVLIRIFLIISNNFMFSLIILFSKLKQTVRETPLIRTHTCTCTLGNISWFYDNIRFAIYC